MRKEQPYGFDNGSVNSPKATGYAHFIETTTKSKTQNKHTTPPKFMFIV